RPAHGMLEPDATAKPHGWATPYFQLERREGELAFLEQAAGRPPRDSASSTPGILGGRVTSLKRLVKTMGRALVWPIRRAFDRRFAVLAATLQANVDATT